MSSYETGASETENSLLVFDLSAELGSMKSEESWQRGDRSARTLMKAPAFNVVLMALKAGARLREHAAPGPISIQVVVGRVRVRVQGRVIDLLTGTLLALESHVAHDVEALEESALLLTVGRNQDSG